MIRIAQISDTHIGLTNPKTLRKMFRRLSQEVFDVVVHCGDFCGGTNGSRSVKTTLCMLREALGDSVPILATIGNHDLWRLDGRNRPGPELFEENLLGIRAAMHETKTHYIDEDGVWRDPLFSGLAIVGCMGWYANPAPQTNDFNFMPLGLGGDTHRFLQRKAQTTLYRNLDALLPQDQHVVFVSHFPVIPAPLDSVPLEMWGGSLLLGEMLREQYGVRQFLNGHSHQLHEGPERFECGPDYGKPTYRIWELR